MSAREAYIAGRSGAPRSSRPSAPKSGGPAGGPTREQKAFDAGQAEKERAVRAQVTKDKGTGPKVEGGLTPDELKQARSIASGTGLKAAGKVPAFKDPYNVLTRKEQVDAGYPKTGIEKLQEITGTKIISPTIQLMAGAGKGVKALLDKWFKNPTAEQLRDPNFLAILKGEIFGKDSSKKDQFVDDYKDIIAKAFGSSQIDKEEAFYQFEDALNEAPEFGVQGEESQRRLAPWDYYDIDKYRELEQGAAMEGYPKFLTDMGLKPLSSRFGNTVDNLERIAGIDVNMPGMPREFRQKIFNAREELARQKGERTRYTGLGSYMGEEPVAGGAGIPDNLANQTFMEDKMDISRREPSLTLGYGPGDMPYTAVIPREGYRYTHDEAGRRYEIPIGYNPLDTGTPWGTTYGGEQFGWRPNPWDMQPVEQTPATGVASLAPTTIDYASMAPQFGPQYRGYVNQGINDPQFASYFKNLQMFPRIV